MSFDLVIVFQICFEYYLQKKLIKIVLCIFELNSRFIFVQLQSRNEFYMLHRRTL